MPDARRPVIAANWKMQKTIGEARAFCAEFLPGLGEDPNLAFPLDRLRELTAAGRIGEVNRRHLSCMGSITAPGRLMRDTAPSAARLLVEDGVDAALLVPV